MPKAASGHLVISLGSIAAHSTLTPYLADPDCGWTGILVTSDKNTFEALRTQMQATDTTVVKAAMRCQLTGRVEHVSLQSSIDKVSLLELFKGLQGRHVSVMVLDHEAMLALHDIALLESLPSMVVIQSLPSQSQQHTQELLSRTLRASFYEAGGELEEGWELFILNKNARQRALNAKEAALEKAGLAYREQYAAQKMATLEEIARETASPEYKTFLQVLIHDVKTLLKKWLLSP